MNTTPKSVLKEKKSTARQAGDLSASALPGIPFLFLAAYLLTGIIPRFDTADVMAPQWIYLTILNGLALFYFLINKELFQSFRQAHANIISYTYLLFFFIACFSGLFAINKIEWMVTLGRLATVLLSFFNVTVFLFRREPLVKGLAVLLTIILFLESVHTLQQFFSQLDTKSINSIIFNLKGNTGNKNILAATLVIKIPFVFYLMSRSNWLWCSVCALVTGLAASAVFFINSRAAYISLVLVFLFTVIHSLGQLKQSREFKKGLGLLALQILPIVLAWIFSTGVVRKAVEKETSPVGYGTFGDRLGSISLSEESSNGRWPQWKSAVDYISSHPFTAAGYGNWKLASIPYEREFTNDLLVTYHVHNDFMEMAAETGWIGGLLYFCLFSLAFYFITTRYFSSKSSSEKAMAMAFLTLGVVYFVDAFFNFPNERPVMQVFLVLFFAFGVISALQKKQNQNSIPPFLSRPLMMGIAFALLLFSIFTNYQTYRSMRAQFIYTEDMFLETPQKSYQELRADLPSIPNLNVFTFPIQIYEAAYLRKEKRYEEALNVLRRSEEVNPYSYLNQFFRAKIFLDVPNLDSAYHYAKMAFVNRPRSRDYYNLFLKVAALKKDSASIEYAFHEARKYRDEAWAWEQYISSMKSISPDVARLNRYLDSANRKFPGAKELESLGPKKVDARAEERSKNFAEGLALFNNKNYEEAIKKFRRVTELDPEGYAGYEDLGICYFFLNQYEEAMKYFDKVLTLKELRDGKSEFYKALCLANLGNTSEGCRFLHIASAKNFKMADNYIRLNCKNL